MSSKDEPVAVKYSAAIKTKPWQYISDEYDALMFNAGFWTEYNVMRAKACLYDIQKYRYGKITYQEKVNCDGMKILLSNEIDKTECG